MKKCVSIMLTAESLRLSLELVNGLCLESVYALKINHLYYSFSLKVDARPGRQGMLVISFSGVLALFLTSPPFKCIDNIL